MIAPLAARGLRHARRFPRPFWALTGADSVAALGAGIFVPYFALYLTTERGASGAQAGGLLALAGVMGIVGAPLGGFAADHFGRRRTLLTGIALSAGFFTSFGVVDSLGLLTALIPLFAIGSDLMGPAISAAIADMIEPELRAEAYGLRRQVQQLAFALGPPLGALIVLGLSLRWLFVFAGIGSLIFFAVVWRELPETKPAHVEGTPRPRFRDALHDRTLLLLALGSGIGVAVYCQFDSVLGVFLHRDRGYALATWGLLFAINPMLIGLFQYVVARWAARRRARTMLASGAVLEGAALFVLWFTSVWPVLVAAIAVLTLGEMLINPVASAFAARIAPVTLRGTYEGVVDTAFAVAWPPSVLVGLSLVGAGHGEVLLAGALPLALVGALCFARLPDP
ncbi:MAG TPA: MFS transporter [Gaiellaceae bacterium]|jgi:MFS family permease